jgi:hypothetical protein
MSAQPATPDREAGSKYTFLIDAAIVARIELYAKDHGITVDQAVARLIDEALDDAGWHK